MNFHEKLRRLLEDRKLCVICKRAGLRSPALSQVLARKQTPRPGRLLQLARALGVSYEWLSDDGRGWPPVRADKRPRSPREVEGGGT